MEESGAIRIALEEGSRATVVCVARSRGREPMHLQQRSLIANGARLHWINITLGGGIEQSLVSTCTGEGAVSTIDWAFRATDHERQSLQARNVFAAGHGGGEILMKGVAEGNASVGASGMIEIGENGVCTHTYLSQHILMLDPTAKVDAVPGLEIKTNDVKASHSATVSRVTPEDLFYFGARGIAEEEARMMYVDGFLSAIVQKIDNPAMRAMAEEILNKDHTIAE